MMQILMRKPVSNREDSRPKAMEQGKQGGSWNFVNGRLTQFVYRNFVAFCFKIRYNGLALAGREC